MNAKRIGLAAIALVAAFLVNPLVASAHHSFGAEYDFNKPVTLHGIVVKWEMINPHSYITLDVKNDDGSVTRWSVQAGAPSFLYRNGWRKDSVKPGDELTITGYMAKDGSHNAFSSGPSGCLPRYMRPGCLPAARRGRQRPQGSRIRFDRSAVPASRRPGGT